MAVSSVTSFILPSFANPTSSSSTRQKVSLLPSSTHGVIGSCVLNKPSVSFTKKVFAAPETLTPETLDEPSSEEFSEVHSVPLFDSFAKTMRKHMFCSIISVSYICFLMCLLDKAASFMCVSLCSDKVYSFLYLCDIQAPSSSSISVDADKVYSSSLL